MEVDFVHREEAVTCNRDKKFEKECEELVKALFLHPHSGKKEAENQQLTRFEEPMDISRTTGSDGADDGARIRVARVVSSHDLEA